MLRRVISRSKIIRLALSRAPRSWAKYSCWRSGSSRARLRRFTLARWAAIWARTDLSEVSKVKIATLSPAARLFAASWSKKEDFPWLVRAPRRQYSWGAIPVDLRSKSGNPRRTIGRLSLTPEMTVSASAIASSATCFKGRCFLTSDSWARAATAVALESTSSLSPPPIMDTERSVAASLSSPERRDHSRASMAGRRLAVVPPPSQAPTRA